MKHYQDFSGEFSNWQTIAFMIISEVYCRKNLRFSRSDLMRFPTLENARKILMCFGHKKDPGRLENTLQRTIQNLRNQGFISFLGDGEYRLTDAGREAINGIDSRVFFLWNEIKPLSVVQVDEFLLGQRQFKRQDY